jgi:hypothetical protein
MNKKKPIKIPGLKYKGIRMESGEGTGHEFEGIQSVAEEYGVNIDAKLEGFTFNNPPKKVKAPTISNEAAQTIAMATEAVNAIVEMTKAYKRMTKASNDCIDAIKRFEEVRDKLNKSQQNKVAIYIP